MNFQINFLKEKIKEAETELASLGNREAELESKIKVTDEAKRLLEALKTAKVKAKKDFILNVINTAMQDIFQQDIRIEIRSSDEDQKIQEKQKKIQIKYDIILLESGIEIGRNEKLLTSNGGGVLSVISLLLKILTGYIYSKNKFYIFDESLAQVSEIYQERLSLFLKQFCDTYGFTIVLINHNPKLATHADMAYTLAADKLDNGLKRLKIEKLEDMRERDDRCGLVRANTYFFEIEKFQSIEKINLEFDGFVSITGANNIGKSAIVRAVNSLIFNNFQENYLRQDASQARIKMEHNDKWAELIYKSKKVFYKFWDGDELSGKKLAQDKIQEKIEQIGFKFLNISKMYKNWKADLKEQVDRLYITTQYDKMYLIGSKSNDSDKLFNFLFDAEVIAQALLNINYDLRTLNLEAHELFDRKQQLEHEVEILKKKLKIEEFYFKKELLKNINDIKDQISLVRSNRSALKTFLEKINIFILNFNSLKQYESAAESIDQLGPRIERGRLLINKFNSIIEKLKACRDAQSTLTRFKIIDNELTEVKKSMNFINSKMNILIKISSLLGTYKDWVDVKNRYYKVTMNIERGLAGREQLNSWWKNKQNEFNIVKCDKCGGLGYHLKN